MEASGLLPNDSDIADFTCALPTNLLSANNISDDTFWTLNKNNILGLPLPDIVKLLYCIFMPIFAVLLIRKLKFPKKVIFSLKILHFLYAISSILLALTVFIFGFLLQVTPSGDFFYGSSDTIRCQVCALAGFLLIYFSTLALHAYASWLLAVVASLVLCVFRCAPDSKSNERLAISLLVASLLVSFLVAVLPITGFGQYEYDRDLGLCLPRVTGQGRIGIENRAYVSFLAAEYFIVVFACIVMFFSLLYVLSNHYEKQQQHELKRIYVLFSYQFSIPFWMISLFVMLSSIANTTAQLSYVYSWLFYMISSLVQIMTYVYVLYH